MEKIWVTDYDVDAMILESGLGEEAVDLWRECTSDTRNVWQYNLREANKAMEQLGMDLRFVDVTDNPEDADTLVWAYVK